MPDVMPDRFVLRCNLEYGWHIVDLSFKNMVVVDEFGSYHDEAIAFCRTLNNMWKDYVTV